MTRPATVFISLVIGLYLALTLPWAFWPLATLWPGLLMFGLYSLLALGLAVDVTEVVLSLCWPPRALPLSGRAPSRGACAVVMTVCDDTHAPSLRGLVPLAEAGYDVYLLDDSSPRAELPARLRGMVSHVHRASRAGAKAGNLNHWVQQYGDRYEYLAILDSDSLMSVAALDTLVRAADCPEHADVGILQAKVEADPDAGSLFARLQDAGARPRARVLERVHGRLGCVVSFGHNQVIRLRALQEVGGFDESLTSEDTVLTLALAARKWRTELVDVWSRDGNPETISASVRRTTRWARQTVELFRRPWYGVPLRLKLLICRHLLNYCLPLVGALLLCFSLWHSPASGRSAWRFFEAAVCFADGYETYGLALWPSLLTFGLFLGLRASLARREGVSVRALLLSTALGSAAYLFLLAPLALALVKSAAGRSVRFVPTRSTHALATDARGAQHVVRFLPAAALLLFLAVAVLRRPGSLLVGFNAVWLLSLFLSPLSALVLSVQSRLRTTP